MPILDDIVNLEDRKESQSIVLRVPLRKVNDPYAPTEIILTKAQEYHLVDRHYKGRNLANQELTSIWHPFIDTSERFHQIVKSTAKFGRPVHSSKLDNLFYVSVHFPHLLGRETGTNRQLFQATIRVRCDGRVESFHPSSCGGKCGFTWMHRFGTCPPKDCFENHFPDTMSQGTDKKHYNCKSCGLLLIYFKV